MRRAGINWLAKVRQVIEMLHQSFLSSYSPHCENSIDEAMVKFKGRSTQKQYMPIKPGFKVWVMSDSHNGYIADLYVCTCREDSTETNLGAKVVKKLSRPLVGGNYHQSFDNFFSSVLVEDGLYGCGTFRKDWEGSLWLSRRPSLV